MYFVFQLEFNSTKTYISSLIKAYAKREKIEVDVLQNGEQIAIVAQKDNEKLEQFLLGLEEILPASIYLGQSRHQFMAEKPSLDTISSYSTPHNIALCPTCQKEMFDISSPRYYYPFTSCNSCGGQHPFLEHYPFKRENTTMNFLQPCQNCQKEIKNNPFREDYPLISCLECGISMKMVDKKSERYANDKGSYKKLFEVSAKAISKGKTVLVKTLNGYRKFFKASFGAKASDSNYSILLMTSANSLNTHLMMVTQEFNSLLSIERPILRVSTKSDELKEIYGSSTLVKYPDDGITILLAKELLNLGLEYISYIECDEKEEADFLVDFDIPITPQKDAKLFINQDTKFFINAQRVVFPLVLGKRFDVVSIANNLSAVGVEDVTVIDDMDRFEEIKTKRVNILEEEDYDSGHSSPKLFKNYQGSMLSVLSEYNKVGQKSVGVHFDTSLYFLYYNGKEVISIVPPNPFEADNMFEHISKLREGSDRLVLNYQKHFPDIYERLNNLSGDSDIFTITAIMLGLKDESFEGISAKALEFMGKGGIQIDTHVKDNRFDNYAFLASIMSYKIAGVEASLICYSIFESFGDYIGEIGTQLLSKTKLNSITFTGETFANQALFARIQRHLGMRKLLFPQNLPIGKESAVVGGLFI
ncbi:MAG: hypothetical protein GXO60_03765 [Epsilonproteobacteria bacterium]|nr:hypothetical protein [Campylobacterota bacterium]